MHNTNGPLGSHLLPQHSRLSFDQNTSSLCCGTHNMSPPGHAPLMPFRFLHSLAAPTVRHLPHPPYVTSCRRRRPMLAGLFPSSVRQERRAPLKPKHVEQLRVLVLRRVGGRQQLVSTEDAICAGHERKRLHHTQLSPCYPQTAAAARLTPHPHRRTPTRA